VFRDLPLAWEAFCDINPDPLRGGNNRVLVTANAVADALDRYGRGPVAAEWQIGIALANLSALGDTYVDLEN
jgi:hypothetical protein